jgi:hypothetical protein
MVSWSEIEAIVSTFRTCIPVAGSKREWCVNKKAIAWERPLSKKDMAALGAAAPKGAVLAIHLADVMTRDAWVETVPGPCFVSPHFANYPAVLVDLERADLQLVTELLNESYEYLLTRQDDDR